jgi:hypothetical protein
LGEHELTPARISCPSLSELTKFGVQLTFIAAIELKSGDGVIKTIRDHSEHCPPVSGCPGVGARFGHRVTISEQSPVHALNVLGCIGPTDLT